MQASYAVLRELAAVTSRPLPPEELFQASLDVLRRACGEVRVHAAGDPAPNGALAVDFPDDDSQPRQLVVLCDEHGAPPVDREALEIAALQIAGALRAARLRGEETPRGAAWTDALTGIANRRAFDRTLASEFARAKNSGAPLSLALLDVDFFKDFNDRYGHVEGDRCLREVAQIIAAGIRKKADFCARYGGEEFAVLLPRTAAAEAAAVAEKIRAAVFDSGIPHSASGLQCVTVSAGLAQLAAGHRTPQQFVDASDARLYAAKQHGRNRVLADGYESQTPKACRRYVERHNLPRYVTAFVGRERERNRIVRMLESSRLVTLAGAGGLGKTRLAVAAAGSSASRYRDGVWFVDLSALGSGTGVADAIAATIGVKDHVEASPLDSLIASAKQLHTLIVLDNCESTLRDAAATVDRLLGETDDLHVLATSRVPLDARGELIWHAAPLSADEAAALFVERAIGSLDPAPGAVNQELIRELCESLDGIPMAIELAAGRLSYEPLQALCDELAQTPRREAILEAVFSWNFSHLDAQEQNAASALCVFAGTFSTQAAIAVAFADEGAPAGREIERLLHDSLLMRDEDGRLRVPNSLAEYAQRRLDEAALRRFRRRHAHYYVELAAAAYRDYGKADMRRWQDALRPEYENLRIVLERGLQDAELLQAGATLAGYLRPYWEHTGLTIEGESWCKRYLEAATQTLPAFVHARLWYGLSRLALLRLDFKTGVTAGEQMLHLYRAIGDQTSVSRALNQLGEAKMIAGSWMQAEHHYEESLAIQRTLDNALGRASALANLANISLHYRMDYERAEEQLTAARVAFRSLGHQSNEAWAAGTLGEVALRRGHAQLALALSDDSLLIFRRLGRHPNMAAELERRARILLALERYDEAENDLREACDLFYAMDNADGLAETLVTLADLRRKRGGYEEAARLLGTSSALRERCRAQFRGHTESDFRAVETPLRIALSERYAELFAEGARAAGEPVRFDA